MIGHLPKLPSGSNAEARFMQSAHELAFTSRIQEAQGQAISRTTKGMVVRPIQTKTAGARVSGPYRLKEEHEDYLTCHDWDPATETEGTDSVYIAKEYKTRHLTSETVVGVTYTYSYTEFTYYGWLETVRTATDGNVTEEQAIRPPWAADELIYAIEATTGIDDPDGNEITLLIFGRTAIWARLGPTEPVPPP